MIFQRLPARFLAFLFLIAAPALPAHAQTGAADEGAALEAPAPEGTMAPDGTMIVATREAPPFAMRGPDGEWNGLAIDLWREIADENDYDYRLVETDLADMIDGLPRDAFDASVGALTITLDREEQVDFSHPFYSTGFGIAVRSGGPDWLALLANFFSFEFLKGLFPLVLVLGFVGMLFWLAERKRNDEEFPADVRGLGAGFWFSAVTMTTVGYGDKAPRTPAGKIVALIWMFAALLITSTFTGLLASSLTAGRLGGEVSNPSDLAERRVGVIAGSSAEEWLLQSGVAADRTFETVAEGLAAVQDEDVNAFVHDSPLMRYAMKENDFDDVTLLPGSFGRQEYGIALPPGSGRREAINRALLDHVESADWQGDLTRVLGDEG